MQLSTISIENLGNMPKSHLYALEGAAAAGLAYFLYRLYARKKRAAKRALYPKDVVILHQFPRGLRAPSASPFPIKLETWYLN